MKQYTDKNSVSAEIEKLNDNIEKCIRNLTIAREKRDSKGTVGALLEMETLIVDIQEFLSTIRCTLNEKQMYWTEEEIEPIISDYLRGAEHYGGMIGRLRCLKPKQSQIKWLHAFNTASEEGICTPERITFYDKEHDALIVIPTNSQHAQCLLVKDLIKHIPGFREGEETYKE